MTTWREGNGLQTDITSRTEGPSWKTVVRRSGRFRGCMACKKYLLMPMPFGGVTELFNQEALVVRAPPMFLSLQHGFRKRY